MPWNPDTYNQFKQIRYQPFFDLVALLSDAPVAHGVDLGCGTGEQTAILAKKYPGAQLVGIDSSREMLAQSAPFTSDRVRFELSGMEAFAAAPGRQWDLVFSNAALQWTDHHAELFPKLVAAVAPGGQFAVQMPVQHENVLNQLLLELAVQEPFAGYLKGWTRPYTLLSVDDYTQLLFDGGLEQLQVMVKVYPIIAPDIDTLYDFISGSALVPYMERMTARQQKEFTAAFKAMIAKAFTKLPAIYAFKRLLLYGVKHPF